MKLVIELIQQDHDVINDEATTSTLTFTVIPWVWHDS